MDRPLCRRATGFTPDRLDLTPPFEASWMPSDWLSHDGHLIRSTLSLAKPHRRKRCCRCQHSASPTVIRSFSAPATRVIARRPTQPAHPADVPSPSDRVGRSIQNGMSFEESRGTDLEHHPASVRTARIRIWNLLKRIDHAAPSVAVASSNNLDTDSTTSRCWFFSSPLIVSPTIATVSFLLGASLPDRSSRYAPAGWCAPENVTVKLPDPRSAPGESLTPCEPIRHLGPAMSIRIRNR